MEGEGLSGAANHQGVGSRIRELITVYVSGEGGEFAADPVMPSVACGGRWQQLKEHVCVAAEASSSSDGIDPLMIMKYSAAAL